jgi:hypothetical protein
MFKRPIVFILGAGASKELLMPTGNELKIDIAESLRFSFDYSRQISGDPVLYRALDQTFGSDIKKCVEARYHLANAMKYFVSIDEALHYFSEQQN